MSWSIISSALMAHAKGKWIVGEQKRRNGFLASGQGPVAATSVDILYAGDETKLLGLTGPKPEHCRVALGQSLYDLVTGRLSCGECKTQFDGLDRLGAVIVCHIEIGGKLSRSSPSWSLCLDCVRSNDAARGTGKPVAVAQRLVHDWFSKQGAHRLPHPAERRRS